MPARRPEHGLTFNGSARDVIGVSLPFWQPSRNNISGVLGGASMDDQGWFDYNPFKWMEMDMCPNLIQMNVAKIGHGKTTLIDYIAAVYSALRIGGDANYEMRVWGDNIRKIHGQVELERLAGFFGEPVVGAGGQRINPLDTGYDLSRAQQLQFLESMLIQANRGNDLQEYLAYALRIAVDWMYREFAEYASLDVLGELMRSLDLVAETAYRNAAPLASRIGLTDAELPPGLLEISRRSGNISEADFKAGAFAGYKLIDRVTKEFGGRFGGRGSDAEQIRQQRSVIYDMSDLPDEAIALNQEFNWLVRNNGNAKQNREFMFQIDIHDENWKLWNYLSYANAMYAYLKQIRSYETLVLMNTHRPNDYQTVGYSDSSPQRQKATKMLSDVGIWYVGKQEAADANEIRHLIGLNGAEERRLTTLGKGQWGVKIGNERMQFVNMASVYVPALRDLSFSNQALRVLLNRGQRHEFEREQELQEAA